MRRPKHILIDGKRYLWRDILELRRAQCAAVAEARQLALFEPRDDARPKAQSTARDRYEQPGLFDS